jgi:hypothetical protein
VHINVSDWREHTSVVGFRSAGKLRMASLNALGSSLKYKNLLVVIKQTAFEEYSQVRAREDFRI